MPTLDQFIQQSANLSVNNPTRRSTSNVFGVRWMAQAGAYLPPWWSPARDQSLRNFWKTSDHLSGAVFTMISRMTAIPFQVVARDRSVPDHVKLAEYYTRLLLEASQFGEGWVEFYSRWNEDLSTTDNGAFVEIIGPGDKSGPITGGALAIAHLDSFRCQRTGHPIYPVIFTDDGGQRHALHFSRVAMSSQMGSPITEMLGVGLCPVSRCVNVAQTLVDILRFKQEKMGSRPHRAIIVTQGGLDPVDAQEAFTMAESEMDSQALSRYARTVVVGSGTLPEADMKVVELSALPDGFDEQTSITLGMATIALAFGVDARELFPALTAGATRADALLQHLKQRGKAPGQILQMTEFFINQKFLPPFLKMEFDFQDDAQDRQAADIKKVRSDRRAQDVNAGAIDQRTLREQMLADNDLTRHQFERMELLDGRLPDGSPVISLFMTTEQPMASYLDFGVPEPLNVASNDPQAVIIAANEKAAELLTMLSQTTGNEQRTMLYTAIIALSKIDELYTGVANTSMMDEQLGRDTGGVSNTLLKTILANQQNKPQGGAMWKNGADPRVRNEDQSSPSDSDRNNESEESHDNGDKP